ncbi:type VI secretion system baseplate subunit TssF [Magnetospirillum sulfuroxidans]|uniref:Type VI secretion system baseplate subunit TssF n=1 Tax=Magnetospirillum sulfuroxidans TaxID=611300 RepID=A0ABS5IE44_9PROT|nr:type VI secretion system baseplate subunit TssF [Magnetospirillum sulfuroxidans]MBR9972008.1 type VI secretion system baseplate subunit TssF [Magnetospirillum sulfuroxidans]
MSAEDPDPLFRAYVNELAYLRTAGGEFARIHPKLARRLELSREGSADPQVQRLIESFAFLTGRIQREIEADFPLIPAAVLGTLYPHLTAPVPSMAIARFITDAEHSRAVMGISVPARTQLFATAEDGLTCRFLSCYPVTLWPITVGAVEVLPPFAIPAVAALAEDTKAAAILRVRLQCQGTRNFAEMTPDRLRFFIDADHATAEALYEVLCHRVCAIAALPDGAENTAGGSIRIEPVGFGADEAVLPHPNTAHQAYRLLQEYFLFPEKYQFLDVAGLPPMGPGTSVDLLFLLTSRPPAGLILDQDTLCLGCTPMVNLFLRTSEPIRLDHTQTEYRLNPDIRWERATEIHTIVKVSDTAAANSADRAILPFFSVSHPPSAGARDCYWMARRQPTGRPDLPGTDIVLSFKDLGLQPAVPESAVLFAHTLCTNRGAAEQLPVGSPLSMEFGAPVASIVCQTRPTQQLAPPEDGETLWQLVSHLSLNHLSLAGGHESLAALKEILHLYGGLRGPRGQQVIDSMEALSTRRIIRRMGEDAWRGFCRGTEVTLTVDDRVLGPGLYLFTAVLSRFLGLYCGVNMFTQLVVASRRHEGTWIRWPAQSGEATIL